MKKLFNLLLVLSFFTAVSAQTYPAAFQWPATGATDQKEQGPCHVFATVSSASTWFNMLFGPGTPNAISYGHLYSRCAGASAGGAYIPTVMNFLKFRGAVDNGCVPYSSTSKCDTPRLFSSVKYFSVNIDSTNNIGALVGNNCEIPWCNCVSNISSPTMRYRLADFAPINLAVLTPIQLKKAIINRGPITLWMNTNAPGLHKGNNHAYSLFGWDASGNWLLTDSWPDSAGINKTKLNIDSIFTTGGYEAFYMTNTANNTTVYRQSYNGSAWNNSTGAPTYIFDSLISTLTISGSPAVTTSGTTYTLNNLSLVDNAVVNWSYESLTGNSSISFSPSSSTAATSVATAMASGTANIVATVSWPNGVRQKVKLLNVTVKGTTVPFTLTNTANNCISNKRNISYQATSSFNGLACTWTFSPAPGSSYSTNINGCTFNVMFNSPLPKGYGLTVAVTSTDLPGAHDGGTTGGTALSCGTGFRTAATDIIAPAEAVVTRIDISPNPANGFINVHLPADQAYKIQLTNMLGAVVHSTMVNNFTAIDISRLSHGVYIVTVMGKTNGLVTKKKVVIQ